MVSQPEDEPDVESKSEAPLPISVSVTPNVPFTADSTPDVYQEREGALVSALAVHDTLDLVYVVDTASNRIRCCRPDGALLFLWGEEGSGPGEFGSVRGVAVDSELNLVLVTDCERQMVHAFQCNGSFVRSAWSS